MGGTGGGGGFSSSDMARMQAAAEARLKDLASKSTKVLFVCEPEDAVALNALISSSKTFNKGRAAVIDGRAPNKVDSELESATFLVCYTNAAKSTSFIDVAIDKAMTKKIGGVHVKGNSKSVIP